MEDLKKYNRSIKNQIVLAYCAYMNIIDFGSGFFQLLHQYEKCNIQSVLGIEPNAIHNEEAKKRIAEKPKDLQNKIRILSCYMEDTEVILKWFETNNKQKMDMGLSFFSLTFPFQSESHFESFITTLKKTIHSQGAFIGTTIDGDAVQNFFKRMQRNEIMGTDFRIEKKWKDDDEIKKTPFGHMVHIDLKDTIVQHQVEYLVDFNYLTKRLKNLGFQLKETGMFRPNELEIRDLSCRDLCSLSRYFIFIKPQQAVK